LCYVSTYNTHGRGSRQRYRNVCGTIGESCDFVKGEAKIIVFEGDFPIDGFKHFLSVEHLKTSEPEIKVSAQTLRDFQRFLRSISDQPITVTFDYFKIYVHSIII
jgi:hypothetical protein